MTERLPRKLEDNVVDVSLGHVILAITTLAGTLAAVGLAIVFARDYAKYRRQKAILETATDLIKTITDRKEGDTEWSEEKKASSSPTKK
jgi:hypothetical protein